MDEPDDVEELALWPVWKQAVKEYFAAGFQDGDVVDHTWLEQNFGMAPVVERITLREHRQRQVAFMANFLAFSRELLEQHRICLISVRGQGWRVTPPAEQTEVTSKAMLHEFRKTFITSAKRLKYVRVEELTADQRRENSDAIAKLSLLRSMQRKALK